MLKTYMIYLFFCILNKSAKLESNYCETGTAGCLKTNFNSNRYILYDVNAPEGFNLRRDVYMRIAVFVNSLKMSNDKSLRHFKLVLPPWHGLYHWRNKKVNKHVPWSHFFDLESLNKFVPVIEMYTFFNDVGTNYEKVNVDEVYNLQHFENMFESGKFEEKIKIGNCENKVNINFYGFDNITSENIKCVSFHGHASQLKNILLNTNARIIFFNHAEVVLHDFYGNKLYWEARRSMRFNKDLRKISDDYRQKYLNSNDQKDMTIIPDNWKDEKPHRSARGGPYICVHLRRRDFLWGRPNDVPSVENAGIQIKILLEQYQLKTVFVATDAPKKEYEQFKKTLLNYEVHKFDPGNKLKNMSDGAIAIIEQIICSHSFYFIGTHESTFSFRIQEEREILGFPAERTFNRLCGDSSVNCDKPSAWKIVY